MLENIGQKNISTQRRNLLNVDEILRIPSNKLLVILRGNKPLLLDKMTYNEHPLFKKLNNNPISEYNPTWIRNVPTNIPVIEKKNKETVKKEEQLGWKNF